MAGYQKHTKIQQLCKPDYMIPVHTKASTHLGAGIIVVHCALSKKIGTFCLDAFLKFYFQGFLLRVLLTPLTYKGNKCGLDLLCSFIYCIFFRAGLDSPCCASLGESSALRCGYRPKASGLQEDLQLALVLC